MVVKEDPGYVVLGGRESGVLGLGGCSTGNAFDDNVIVVSKQQRLMGHVPHSVDIILGDGSCDS